MEILGKTLSIKEIIGFVRNNAENPLAFSDSCSPNGCLMVKAALELASEVERQKIRGWTRITTDKSNMPPVGQPLIVTIKDVLQGKPNELRYPVYYEKDPIRQSYHWSWRYGDLAYELLPDVSEVIAWQEMPGVYQELKEI